MSFLRWAGISSNFLLEKLTYVPHPKKDRTEKKKLTLSGKLYTFLSFLGVTIRVESMDWLKGKHAGNIRKP